MIPQLLAAGGAKLPLLLVAHLCRDVFGPRPALLRHCADHIAHFCVFSSFAAAPPGATALKGVDTSATLAARVLLSAFAAGEACAPSPSLPADVNAAEQPSGGGNGTNDGAGRGRGGAAGGGGGGGIAALLVRKLLSLAETSPLLAGREPSQSTTANACKVQLWQTLCLLSQRLTPADLASDGGNESAAQASAGAAGTALAAPAGAAGRKRKHPGDGSVLASCEAGAAGTGGGAAAAATTPASVGAAPAAPAAPTPQPSDISQAAWRCLQAAKQHANVRRLVQMFAASVFAKVRCIPYRRIVVTKPGCFFADNGLSRLAQIVQDHVSGYMQDDAAIQQLLLPGVLAYNQPSFQATVSTAVVACLLVAEMSAGHAAFLPLLHGLLPWASHHRHAVRVPVQVRCEGIQGIDDG